MPQQTPPKPAPDPYDPVEPDRPFTRLEITSARLANACDAVGAAFNAVVNDFAAAKLRDVADRVAERKRAAARFERCRTWVRDHPDAP